MPLSSQWSLASVRIQISTLWMIDIKVVLTWIWSPSLFASKRSFDSTGHEPFFTDALFFFFRQKHVWKRAHVWTQTKHENRLCKLWLSFIRIQDCGCVGISVCWCRFVLVISPLNLTPLEMYHNKCINVSWLEREKTGVYKVAYFFFFIEKSNCDF